MNKKTLGERVKNMIRNWLDIQPAEGQSISLKESMTFETEVMRSQIWYRGDASEIRQFFRQLQHYGVRSGFWESVPETENITMKHSGLPAIIADVLAYIVVADLDKLDCDRSEWKELTKPDIIDMPSLINNAIVDTLVDGDGAFKISLDESLTKYPIVEFIGADRVEYEQSRGITKAIVFKTVYEYKSKRYVLKEKYLKGRIESRLYDANGNEVSLDTLPMLDGINPILTFSGDYMMAVPLKFFVSKKHKGRGKSVFDGGRSDCFDALDEVISEWWDALRAGRVTKYIPEDMIPRDDVTGALGKVNSFGTSFVTVASSLKESGETAKIQIVQPDINYEAFVESYSNALLMCLQGLVSPATLGIDIGKMSSADAQREKKDVTGDTRNTITSKLEIALPQLIKAILWTYDNMRKKAPEDCGKIEVSFGEYGAPDFDSRVETVGKAATYGIMSIDTQIEELWGSSKDDAFKKAEAMRIKSEKGMIEGEPPSVGDELA